MRRFYCPSQLHHRASTHRKIGKLLLLAAMICIAPGAAHAAMLVNGSFESPILGAGSAEIFNSGSDLGGWTVVGNAGTDVRLTQTTYSEIPNGMSAFQADDGMNSLDVTGQSNQGSTAGIEQSVATLPGDVYTMTFAVGRAQSSNGAAIYQTAPTIDLILNGAAPIAYTNPDTARTGLVGWHPYTMQFTASAGTTVVEFLNATPGSTNFAGLDGVTLTPAPEPSMSGLVVVLLAIRGRRHDTRDFEG